MDEWKQYEAQIFNKLSSEFRDCQITANDHIYGNFSRVMRQVDIAIRGTLAGKEILGVVECKHFSRNVDVKVVDSFVGFLEDVGANVGIIITTQGYTKAAKNRAQIKLIHLDVVDFNRFDEYEFEWDSCELCDPGPEHPPAMLSWYGGEGMVEGDNSSAVLVGRCDWCNGIHIRCTACGSMRGVGEGDYEESLECYGACGLVFEVYSEHVGKGMYEERIRIHHPGKQRTQRRR